MNHFYQWAIIAQVRRATKKEKGHKKSVCLKKEKRRRRVRGKCFISYYFGEKLVIFYSFNMLSCMMYANVTMVT